MSRPKAQGSLAKNQLQLAIALSTSLEESKTRELSKLAEELPADVIEEGAIPHNIKQMQKEFLERLKPVATTRSKRNRTTNDVRIPVLFTRSSGERMRIVTEKVALILIKENNVDFMDGTENDPRILYLDGSNKTSLWDISFLETSFEERHLYYISNLSAFISPRDEAVSAIPKYRPLPGRFLSPRKREPVVETPSKMSSIKDIYEFSTTKDHLPLHKEALLEFQNDWLVMLDNPTMSDILIYTKSKPLPAHKLILHARCPIILKDLDDSGSLSWVDVTRLAAVLFLKFIYSGQLPEIEPWMEEAEEVRYLARKYCVVALISHLLNPAHIDFDSEGEPGTTLIGKEWERPFSSKISFHQPPIPSDKSTKELDPTAITSADSTPLEITFEKRISPVSFSPMANDSLKIPEKSMQILQGENSTRNLATNESRISISDDEEVPSPFKCTILDLGVNDISDSNPATPQGQSNDEQDPPSPGFKRSFFEITASSKDSIILTDSSKRKLQEDARGPLFPKSNRRTLQFSPMSDDFQILQDHSKQKLQNKKSPGKFVTTALCIDVSDEEDIQPLNKSTTSDVNALDNWEPPAGQPSSDEEVSPFKELLDLNTSHLSDSVPETPQGVDTCRETAGKSPKYSPLKTSRSNTNVPGQDYKIYLEDSFRFDLSTPPPVWPECATPMRTPLTDIKTSSPATPMPDYWAMSSEELQAELCRYGLKRSLPISKGIKMLKHIYLKLHPLVEVVVKGGRELFIPIGDKTPIPLADFPPANSLPVAIPTKVDEPPEPPDDIHLLSDSSSDGSEVMEESMFADEDPAGYEGLTDLAPIIRSWISSNQDLHEKVLRYEPIWLESVHSELKEYTHQNIKLSHLMSILDEEGVTFRLAQKGTDGGRKKKQGSKKRKNVCGEETLQSKKLKDFEEL